MCTFLLLSLQDLLLETLLLGISATWYSPPSQCTETHPPGSRAPCPRTWEASLRWEGSELIESCCLNPDRVHVAIGRCPSSLSPLFSLRHCPQNHLLPRKNTQVWVGTPRKPWELGDQGYSFPSLGCPRYLCWEASATPGRGGSHRTTGVRQERGSDDRQHSLTGNNFLGLSSEAWCVAGGTQKTQFE